MTKPTNKKENVLSDLLELCEDLNRIPSAREIMEVGVVGSNKTLQEICQSNGYIEYKDFCRQNGFGYKTDVYIHGEYRCHSDLSLDDLVFLWIEFKEKYNRFPTKSDLAYRRKCQYNLPAHNRFMEVLDVEGLTFNDFKDLVGDSNKRASIDEYAEHVEKYKEISVENGSYLTHKELTCNTYGLPDARWLVKYCPDKNIKNFNHFVEWCGFVPIYEVSRELATEIILEKSNNLNRPVTKYDFCNPNSNEVGMGTITRIWGTFNSMKRDIGLEIVQESLFKEITFDKVKDDLINVCNTIYEKEKRTTVNTFDIAEYGEYSYSTHNKYFKDRSKLMSDFLEDIGFSFQKVGCGISNTFSDGEVTLSRFETVFSNYLRDTLKLGYNVDYFRDVRYSEFIASYEGFMDCDYIIHIEDQIIYIEIAGILRDYKSWYDKNREISSSKSKERYKQTLKEKESMLKENNSEYHIIFPQDCNEEFFDTLFKREDVDKCGKINSL